MSVERLNLLKAYGAELVLTDGAQGMKGAIARAKELADSTPDSFIPGHLPIPPIPRLILNQPGRKSGMTQTERWIFLLLRCRHREERFPA